MTSQNEIAERVDALLGLQAQGYSYNNLIKVATQTWNVSERQAKRYLAMVKDRIADLITLDSDDYWASRHNELHRMWIKALQEGNTELALKIKIQELNAREQYMQEKGRHGTAASSPQHSPHADTINSLLAALEEDGPAPMP